MSTSTKPQTSFVMPDGDVAITPEWLPEYTEMALDNYAVIYYAQLADPDSIMGENVRELTIPEVEEWYIRDRKIRFTSIAKNAFYGLDALSTINLPSTIKTIDPQGFGIYPIKPVININNYTDAIPGAPWGLYQPVINWLKGPAIT